jgi:hypothetical protein
MSTYRILFPNGRFSIQYGTKKEMKTLWMELKQCGKVVKVKEI